MSQDRTPEAITQSTSIAEADQILQMSPVIVPATASLREVAELAVRNTGCRVIAVVDEERRLVGVLPVRALVNDVFLKIVPEEFLGEISDLGAALEYAQHIAARTAADIMIPAVSLRATETVRTAFERMHHSHLNGLPIVDDANRVVGYLDQFELLMVWIQSTGRGALLRPSSDSPA